MSPRLLKETRGAVFSVKPMSMGGSGDYFACVLTRGCVIFEAAVRGGTKH